jgi:basic amino acid/polyamine antiporter, APA family
MTKMVILVFLVAVSFMFFNIKNYTPLLSTIHPEYGVSGIVVGATLVFFAYLGFDIIPAVAEEA